MGTSEAVEMVIEESGPGRARLEVVTRTSTGEQFTIEIEGPADEVRDEAAYLAEQYRVLVAV
jgi:hypothetical protein